MRPESVKQRMMLAGTIRVLEAEIVRSITKSGNTSRRSRRPPSASRSCSRSSATTKTSRRSYNSLSNRKLEADISVNMEKKQKGEQFQILDVARLPEKPVSPDVKRLFMMTILAGLGSGAAWFFSWT